jgi:hypothetical protein
MKRRFLVMALAAMSAWVIAPPAQASHSWGGYHWARTSNPFTLTLGDNVSTAWDSTLRTTASDWSQSAVLDTIVGTGRASPRNCRPTVGRVEVCNSTYGNNGWLGIAQVWISGSHITQGTVKLNDSYFNTATYNTPAWRNLVSCQEVGHTLGLDHQDENFDNANLGTCMDYTRNPSTNQRPNSHDYAQLVSIYTHTDSTTTVGQSTSTAPGRSGTAADEGPDTPAEFGRPTGAKDNFGRDIIFEQDLPDGGKRFTHVFWTLPGSRGNSGGGN